MNRIIYRSIRTMIENGKNLEEIKRFPYFERWFLPEMVEDFYNQTIKRMNKEKNKKIHIISVRLDDTCFELVKKNRSKMTREAILRVYGVDNNHVLQKNI